MTTQDVYVEQAKAQLDRLNAEIKKLRAEADAMHSAGKADLARQIETLKERREEAETNLTRLRDASGDAWSDLKDGFENARHALADGIDKARKQYSQG